MSQMSDAGGSASWAGAAPQSEHSPSIPPGAARRRRKIFRFLAERLGKARGFQ